MRLLIVEDDVALRQSLAARLREADFTVDEAGTASEAEYFLLCDQDDVWLPQKVRRLRESIYVAEAQYGQETPLIVHSDLIPTDRDLNPIAPSYWRYQRMVWPDSNAPWRSHNACVLIPAVVLRCSFSNRQRICAARDRPARCRTG